MATRAARCPILLNAIFALSARHLNLIGDYDQYVSNHYHDKCLQALSKHPTNAIAADETLFAALIVLRVLEEIDRKFSRSGAPVLHQ